MSAALVEARGLAKAYPGPVPRTVLRGVDLMLGAGEFVAVMGESGAGKSTLLNLLAGLDTPDAGRVAFDGRDLGGLDDDARTLLRRHEMGFVFQAFHLLPHLTAAENIILPLALNGWPAAERAARAAGMLAAVGLAERAAAYPRELSGGETQRVAVARALAHRPRLLLADEPTGNLDAANAVQVMALIARQVGEQGCAALLVTHSERAAARADRVLRLTPDGLGPA
ncbi:MAG: ABC transporter ATP-binding protein [Thiobacillaceae bacterium]|nr:ABC transporter ATP-binding protein [Thiobacillaceae bacterium]